MPVAVKVRWFRRRQLGWLRAASPGQPPVSADVASPQQASPQAQIRSQRGHSRRHERSQSSPKSQAQQPLPQQALSQQASSPQALSQQASQRRSLCIGFRWLSGGVTLDSRGQSSHHPSGRTFTTPMPRSGISDLPTRCFSWRRARHARFRAGATRPTVSNARQRPSRARPMHPSRRGAVRVA
jgi:hypothetical protein